MGGTKRGEAKKGSDNKPLISLAMMVKNEEAFLPACLASVAPWVDEIVVVDTGSTDGTVAIAESYGARVYHHPWQRHFSLHRNQSIGYCAGKWIFILDADEELMEGSGAILRRAAQESKADIVYAMVRSLYDSGRSEGANISERLIRNNGVIHYEGRVHNLLVGYNGGEAWPINISHKGYNVAGEQKEAKFERTSTLLKEDIAEDPSNPRPRHYLAAAYLSNLLAAEALPEAHEAIRLAAARGDETDLYIWSHYLAAASSFELGRDEEAEHWCREALRKRPIFFDACFMLARVALRREDWNAVLVEIGHYFELLARFRKQPASFGQLILNTARSEWHAWHHRAVALSELGRGEEAEEAFAQALNTALDKAYCLRLRGRYLAWRGEYEAARDYYRRSLALDTDKCDVLFDMAGTWNVQGRFDEEYGTLERLLAVRFVPKVAVRAAEIQLRAGDLAAARAHLERALEEEPENVNALTNLGYCLRMENRPEAAMAPLRKACELDPGFAPAHGNLAEAMLAVGDPGARDALGRALELAPGLEAADLRLKRCRLALQEGDVDSLLADCGTILRQLGLRWDRPLETPADLAELLMDMGERLLDSDNSKGGEEALRLAGEVAPQFRQAVGELYGNRGLWPQALEHLQAQLTDGPAERRSEVFQDMGELYTRLGQVEAARLCRAEAARLGSTVPAGGVTME
ncbi:MAG: glycosyltransferase [Pseudomonadota bacterium]